MKNFIKYVGIAATVISIILVAQAVRIGMMFVDFQKTVKDMNEPAASAPVKRLDPPEFMVGLTPPEGFVIMGEMTSSLPTTNQEKSLVKDEKIIEHLEKVDKTLFSQISTQMRKNVVKQIKNLPEPLPVPEILDISSPMLSFRQIRETARYWYLLGRYYAIIGDFDASLTCFAAISMLGHITETYPAESSASLISRMIATAVRNIGHTGLLESLPKLKMPANKLKQWLGVFLKLEKAMPSMARCLTAEKRMIPSVFHPKNMKASSGMIQKMQDKNLQDKYIGAHFDPLIKACDSPFPQAVEIGRKKDDDIEKMMADLFTVSSLQYYFWPEELFIQFMMTIAVPNFKRAFNTDFRCRNIMRGTIAALALHAYQSEHNRFPDNLEALQKWLGRELPHDAYIEKPFSYNPGSAKILFSVGEDGKADTEDDLVFMPL